ncbi:probable LRR receptor-like serine/threonine-protein kinase At3g47570 [Papaver somniferum]|uniref:probable LRR receptor-like serine/threonine-protein kinase At3g47570 n=1 Tax=Papaver somniferum TaxID=3469 RepID=UPI000E6F6912|nr:probable LRR receptor-like serine/threonine-protein kinase At3g47570 [Papaver somniferum]
MDFHLHHLHIFKFSVSIFILILSSTNSRNNSSFVHYVESSSLTVDREALLLFKSSIIDPSNTLSSWNTSLNNVCEWTGVICDQVIVGNNSTRNKNQTRVTGLDLEGLGLSGTLSLGSLSFLRVLHLPNNKFSGTLTLPNYIGELCQLRTLNISSNNIHGQIPLSIVKCSELRILDLMGNQFTGNIPPEIGQYLLRLQVLKLNQNQLSGTIPPSIGNISSLTVLDLGTNTIGGPIPSELGRLQKLKTLSLSINNLTGTVPPSLYNIASLVHFALPSNNLWGEIPSDVGDKLPNLIDFNFCINKFTGGIPGSLHYLPNIQNIRMAHNLLEGTVPPGLGNLRSLRMYNVGYNRIAGSLDFISSFRTSPHLDFLALDGNLFQGAIPESIGFALSATKLTKLYLGGNRISGKIPPSISLLTNLALLNLSYNSISGEIPPEIGDLKNLQELVLAENKISGGIPPTLGDLNKLNVLDLHGNGLSGAIPNSLGSLQRLNSMDLSRNELNGSIPGQVLSGISGLSSLLNMSRNSLSGSLPQEVRNLKNLVTIDVSHNKLSGSIPNSIEGCRSLQKLFMSSNSFSGRIPSRLANVLGLEILDLSSNQLSGPIPNNLEKLQALHFLNLSYNNLEGQLPSTGVFENFTNVYVQGNFKLCANSSHFSSSLSVCRQRRKKSVATRVVVLLIIASSSVFCLLLVASFVYYMLIYRKNAANGGVSNKIKVHDEELFRGRHQLVSYEELRAATDNFDEANLVGSGSFGSVYKGKLWGEVMVAVKVLNLDQAGASKSFFAECDALKSVRHRNLVKLITSCSSIVLRKTNSTEFRALVYEFLSNGSLDDWIRGRIRRRRTVSSDDDSDYNDEENAFVNSMDYRDEDQENGPVVLNGVERLNVAIDVASALDYLHHDCEVPVVHCDLKPSNIILDHDMTAKVGDFGLARTLLNTDGNDQSTTTATYGLKGSIGYIPPEYGQGLKPSTRGDVYSFGIMLLEMFTGRSPTHEGFNGGISLVKWVESVYPNDILQVLDPQLQMLHQTSEPSLPIIMNGITGSSCHFEDKQIEHGFFISTIGVGLSCALDAPEMRITIREALQRLKKIRDSLVKSNVFTNI